MSDALPAVPSASAGIPSQAHSDVVVNLFRELGSRNPAISLEDFHAHQDGGQPDAVPSGTSADVPVEVLPESQAVTPAASSAPLNPPPVHSDSSLQSASKKDVATASPYPYESFDSGLSRSYKGLVAPEPAEPAPDTGSPLYYFLSEEPARSEVSSAPQRSAIPPVATFDLEEVRRDFPALQLRFHGQPLVYLDNAATTQKPKAVIDATSYFYSHLNAPVHRAAYELAERATQAFEEARDKVREFLSAKDKKEIVFTRGTTEAINLVANTYGRKFIGKDDEIIVSELEHHANIVPWQLLSEQTGAVLKVIPINDRGEILLEEYVKLIGPRTKLVSVAHVSNSLGSVNPIEQIIQIAHAKGVPVLIDGAQSTPHMPVNVQALDADFFVFSGHKIFGPTGIGALYAKAHILESLPPWQGGGHMIRDVRFEKTVFQNPPEKFEAGTPDMAGAYGLGAAIDYLLKIGMPAIAAYEHALLEYATHQLTAIPGLKLIGTSPNKASVLSFVLDGFPNEKVARHLDLKGIAVRAGHHCALPAQRHFGLESTVRPSLAFYNTREDVDLLVQALYSLIK